MPVVAHEALAGLWRAERHGGHLVLAHAARLSRKRRHAPPEGEDKNDGNASGDTAHAQSICHSA